MGFSPALAQILVAPPYVSAIMIALFTSWLSDKYHRRVHFIWVHVTLAIVGFLIIMLAPTSGGKLVGTFFAVAGAQANVPCMIAFAQNNIVSGSERGVGSAIQIMFGGIAGIVASVAYQEKDAPQYVPGLATTIAFEGALMLLTGTVWFIFRRQNERLARGEIKLIEGQPGFKHPT